MNTDTKTTVLFQNSIWSIVKTICPTLEKDIDANQHNRSAWQGTQAEWTVVSTTMREMRNTVSGSEKRSLTAAIKNIELLSGQGGYYEEYMKQLEEHKAAMKARRAARKAARNV